MAALVKAVRIARTINNATKLLTNLSLSPNNPHTLERSASSSSSLCKINWSGCCPIVAASFHTTTMRSDLMEFFDDEKNWGKNIVMVGRSWKKDELRLKSNEDLHKLWYVLLKERNMLLTMEAECKREYELFPNPERIDKIADSMDNLECVVRERNQAYHQLETGESGERPKRRVSNQIGMKFTYRLRQYSVPQFMNSNWYKTYKFNYGGYAVRKFLKLYNEQKWNKKRKARGMERSHVAALLRKFPNLDEEALKAKFPNVDVDRIKTYSRSRGHYLPK